MLVVLEKRGAIWTIVRNAGTRPLETMRDLVLEGDIMIHGLCCADADVDFSPGRRVFIMAMVPRNLHHEAHGCKNLDGQGS